MEKDEQNAYLDAQAQIYRDLGQALFEMVDPLHHHDWDELVLDVAQNEISGQAVHSIRVTLALRDGARLPLLPSAPVAELARRLDLLTRTHLKGRTWRAFSYRLYHGPSSPAYECDYTYAENVH
jgi:hypothetical protein